MNTRSSQTPASATQLKMLQKSAQSAQTIFTRTLKQDYWTRTFVSSHLIIEVIHLTAMSQQF